MGYINQQICDNCLSEKNRYKFECESCGLEIIACCHNVYKCYECNNFFCGKCSEKYQQLPNNMLICNQYKKPK